MEVRINKDIRLYRETFLLGLDLRQSLFSVMACAAAAAVYFLLGNRCGAELLSWLCTAAAVPFALLGFWKYKGMPPEKLAYAMVRSFRLRKPLLPEQRNLFAGCQEEAPKEKRRNIKEVLRERF
jgi:hypothetical protein